MAKRNIPQRHVEAASGSMEQFIEQVKERLPHCGEFLTALFRILEQLDNFGSAAHKQRLFDALHNFETAALDAIIHIGAKVLCFYAFTRLADAPADCKTYVFYCSKRGRVGRGCGGALSRGEVRAGRAGRCNLSPRSTCVQGSFPECCQRRQRRPWWRRTGS